jgi:hypothetical protein
MQFFGDVRIDGWLPVVYIAFIIVAIVVIVRVGYGRMTNFRS